jgi:hypothetical protein
MAWLGRSRRFRSQAQLDVVRRLLGWTSPELARRIRAGSLPLADLDVGEFVLFVAYASCGLALPISSFFLLLLEEYGLQLQHLTPQSILLVVIFAHFMEMFMGVKPCVSVFKHYYSLVGSRRSKDEIGGYYFQLRHSESRSYISAFSSAKWEGWRNDRVITRTDASNRLELPSEAPVTDRDKWKAKPTLSKELKLVLDRVTELARRGLTQMMVLGDFLQRRIAPLQQRSRLAYMYTGTNDCSRLQRGVGTELTEDEFGPLLRGVTGESYDPAQLVLPRGIVPLCDDQKLRQAVQASLPTLDDAGLAVL